MGCGVKSGDEAELDVLISSPDFQETRDFLDFLESLEDSFCGDHIVVMRERLGRILCKLRGQKEEDSEALYGSRRVESLVDSLLDTLEEKS